jgi:hypothetical protein
MCSRFAAHLNGDFFIDGDLCSVEDWSLSAPSPTIPCAAVDLDGAQRFFGVFGRIDVNPWEASPCQWNEGSEA